MRDHLQFADAIDILLTFLVHLIRSESNRNIE